MTVARRGGWPGPRKIRRVVPQHPDQVAAVQTYADRHGINYAEAMRQLIDAGLDEMRNRP